MPLYQFKCDDCGTFEEWRSLAKSSDPAYCPSCQELSKRIFSPPTILSSSLRLKRENREPQLEKRQVEPKQPRVSTHRGGRPWMISH